MHFVAVGQGSPLTDDHLDRPSPGPLPDDRRQGPAKANQTRSQPVADPAPQTPDLQQKYRQFLDLLPLTIALAGLPPSEGRLFGEDQIEGRGITVKDGLPRCPQCREGMPGRIVRPMPVACHDRERFSAHGPIRDPRGNR